LAQVLVVGMPRQAVAMVKGTKSGKTGKPNKAGRGTSGYKLLRQQLAAKDKELAAKDKELADKGKELEEVKKEQASQQPPYTVFLKVGLFTLQRARFTLQRAR